MSARLRLRRSDGDVYLDRWGFEWPAKAEATDTSAARRPFFGVFVHRMDAADPGVDLHDHPWWFGSLILWGGYDEEREDVRRAPLVARWADMGQQYKDRRGEQYVRRRWLSWRTMRLDECHRITRLHRAHTWTLVIHGPWRRSWGFYMPDGWLDWRIYDGTVRADRRDMWAEISNDDRVADR